MDFFPLQHICVCKDVPEILPYLLIFQVDINNLDEYISLVVDATVKTGIIRQMEAFRSGFNQVSGFLCPLWISMYSRLNF